MTFTRTAFALALAFADDPPQPTNVLFIVIDTLRADRLGCYGCPRATSPCIDRFAASATRFERAFTAWPETCESMAAMLSGTWCQTNGVVVATPQAIAPELELLPETLAAAGWRTAAFVMNDVLARRNQFDQGIERYVEVYLDQDNPGRANETQLARAWLRENGSQRFFLWVHYVEPHAPYSPIIPDRFVADPWYDPARRVEVRTPARRLEPLGGIPGISAIEGHDELAYYLARYDSEIVDVDAKVGLLLRELDLLGLNDRTIVVLVSDHGEGFGEHDYFWHGLVPYDETAHVPLLVRAPGRKPGVAGDVVSTIDVAPTLLELLGLPRAPLHEGRSLVPLLDDPTLQSDRLVFTESGRDPDGWQRSVRDRRFKLVQVRSAAEREKLHLDEWTLFDLVADPAETRNVIADHPDVAKRLEDALAAWTREQPLFRAPPSDLSPEEAERVRQLGYGE